MIKKMLTIFSTVQSFSLKNTDVIFKKKKFLYLFKT